MSRKMKTVRTAVSVLGVMVALAGMSYGQSGSRSSGSGMRSSGSTSRTAPSTSRSTGSASRQMTQMPVALEGYCPVSIVKMHKWVKGNPSLQLQYDGHVYRFAEERGMKMFQEHPAAFVPALGGDCVVAQAKMGKRVPGNIRNAAFHQGRIFLFSSKDGQQQFLANPNAYDGVDLALGGNCPVCLTNMRQNVPGMPEYVANYQGMRYLFPSAAQQGQFMANPRKFATARPASGTTNATSAAGSTMKPTTGSTVKPRAGSGSSSR